MKRVLVTAFGNFLSYDFNSSEDLLEKIPKRKGLTKAVLPVGYFKRDFIKEVEKSNAQKVVFLGMHETRKVPTFEVRAVNEQITLKNSFVRFLGSFYSHYLKWQKKNLRVKNPIPKEKLTTFPIEKRGPKKIDLVSKPPKLKHVKVSKDAGNYVCNYAMWVVERHLRESNKKVEFYFIHLPLKLSENQKKELIAFILS